ncbi:3-oxoadipate CoA-transferase [Oceanicola sp. 22II-s10i]|uniref:3-oxoacid CoA-transferase subunit A n=1 Tax=Oceanicola sp. 22II-s10i TaxID=1317116 RepID=UPI000B5210F4|nr:3-oxoacid CoA-transferase subunit A [Oceanicola sp. 22II-s10i]OWU84774.1 3-oxoadipate CoA-transferase [Oceanicola sp. 22II-s10i]
MLDRRCKSLEEALDGIEDGASIMVSGFGDAGRPNLLLKGLIDKGVKDLHIISNNAGSGFEGLAMLFRHRMISRLTCSFPRGDLGKEISSWVRDGSLTVEVNPQGTMAERIRAAGCGIPAFFTPTAYGTKLGEGKETRDFNGKGHVLETALHADYAFVHAEKADRWGNLMYKNLSRNFAPLMAMAAKTTIVEARHIVELGDMDPNVIMTPGVCVNRLVQWRPVAANEWGIAA